MKVVGFNGSPRMLGNTGLALDVVLERLADEGFETEHVYLCQTPMDACDSCGACNRNMDGNCIIVDAFSEHYARMLQADAIVFASPCYFGGVTAQLKGLMDRAGNVARSSGDQLSRKVGLGLVTERREGGLATLHQIHDFMMASGMVVAPSDGWPIIRGHILGEGKDSEGVEYLESLADGAAWLLRALDGQAQF